MEKTNHSQRTSKASQRLTKALNETEMLLAYATRHGIDLDDEVISTITRSKDIENNNNWDAESEALFWKTYTRIAKAVKPVTVDSLQITEVKSSSNFLGRFFGLEYSEETRTARNYTFWALLLIVLVLVTQIMSLVGSNLLDDTKKLESEIKEIETERNRLWRRSFEVSKSLYLHEIIYSGSRNKNSETDWQIKQLNHRLWALHTELMNTVLDLGEWFPYMVNEQAMHNIRNTLYSAYDDTVGNMVVTAHEEIAQEENRPDSEIHSNDTAGPRPVQVTEPVPGTQRPRAIPVKNSSSGTENLPEPIQNGDNPYIYTLTTPPEVVFSVVYPDIERIITAVRSPIEIMQIYLLPLLYGMVGAFAYVLRKFTSNLRVENYQHDSKVSYLLRVFLGAIAGLTIRMFFFPSGEETGLAIYSPLALSFLAGYGVELLFSTMDRLIASASRGRQNKSSNE